MGIETGGTRPLKEFLSDTLRSGKLGLGHPLVKQVFSADELVELEKESATDGSLIVNDAVDLTSGLSFEEIDEMRRAVILEERKGFKMPEDGTAGFLGRDTRVRVLLQMDPDSVERVDFNFRAELKQGVAEENARQAKAQWPGVNFEFTWDGRPQTGAIKKGAPLPSWMNKDWVTVKVTGVPKDLSWANAGALIGWLALEV